MRKIKAETIYADEEFTCPHCGESWALFLREDNEWDCHRCLTTFDREGRICINPMEVSDEEFHRHKKEMHKRYEQWFLNLCQEIWDTYFAGMFTTKGADDGSDGDK